MSKENIENWKLQEVIEDIDIVNLKSQDYNNYLFEKLKLPKSEQKRINRANTQVDWNKLDKHFKFFFDGEGEEKSNGEALRKSKLSAKDRVIILYGYNEPAVSISTELFIKEWEDFIASTQWETIIISEDLELFIEISRDYYMHSNFFIK